jgi:hypothetical protein
MNRRTLFATLAGLFCVRAKAEPEMVVEVENETELWLKKGSLVTVNWTIEGGVFRVSIDNTWSEKLGKQ